MADTEVTGLPAASSVAAVDLLHVKQGGIDKKAAVSLVLDLLVAAAPGALNTLDELAAALGDDANFAATVTAALAAKAPIATPTFTGPVTLGQAPTLSLHAATKAYTDAAVAAGAPNPLERAAVRLATADQLPGHTFGSNVLTAAANGALTVDGTAVVLGDRILVKNELAGAKHWIYTVTAVGSAGAPWTLTRATDSDTSAEVVSGVYTTVSAGVLNANTKWSVSTADPIVLNTTVLTVTQLATVPLPITGSQTTTTRKDIFKLQPTVAGVGPFAAGMGATAFSGTFDHVFDLGYNPRKMVPTEPSFTLTMEADFNESGFHWQEDYVEYFGKDLVALTVATKALTGNVATIGTTTNHGLSAGMGVQVGTGDAVFDGNVVVASTPTATTFTYARTNADVASTASGGSVGTVQYRPWFLGIGRANGQLIRSQYLAGSDGFQILSWDRRAELANIGVTGMTVNSSTLMVKSPVDRPQIILQVGTGNDLVLASDSNAVATLKLDNGKTVAVFQAYATYGGFLSVGTSAAPAKITARSQHVDNNAGAFMRFSAGQVAPILAVMSHDESTLLWSVNPAGIPRWDLAANQQTTVGAAGGASALPATPTKYLKVVDSAGTVLVVPAYAAS